MRKPSNRTSWLGLALVAGITLMGHFLLENPLAEVQAQGGKKGGVPVKDKDVHAADRAAIQKAVESFVEAFERRDPKAIAAHWTENGEYVSDDGQVFRGRAAIEKEYVTMLGKSKETIKLDVEMTSLRFPSKDTAIEEGYIKMRRGKEPVVTSKYSVLHVREGGKWLMAVVREWPSEGASIRDLEWLIGAWETKREDREVRTVYEWWGDKTFIKGQITIKSKQGTSKGFMLIGKDSATGQLRSWTFDEDGSFAEGSWTRDGSKWLIEAGAVQANGDVVAATNILTPIDHNAFSFQSVQRSVNGEEIPDIAPVRVTRVKN